MARTLIGQLILRLQAQGLGEAQKVRTAMSDIEAAARRLGSTGVGSWGVGFQRQLDRLRLTKHEIGEVQQSWVALQDSIRQRGLDKALRGAEISHWKTQTVATFAQMRGEVDNHLRAVEQKARAHADRMSTILKPGLVMLGAYTLPYAVGVTGVQALRASSERRREFFRQEMANVSPEDQDRIFERSEAIGQEYPSVPITAIMEASRNAYALMGDVDRAMQVVDGMAQAFVVTQSTRGPQAAMQQLTQFLRGLDRLGVNKEGQKGIDDVLGLLDAAAKASQVDPDFDIGSFFSFARRTKVAGPALSNEFLARAPVYIQDMGSDTTGNQLAMGFKAFLLEAVGSAGGKKYLQERERIGIRDENGIIDPLLFGSNPDQWAFKYLIPALKRDGVDMTDDTAIAAAIGKLSGNTNATGFFTALITQREQNERWLELMEKAMGLDAADDARFKDPFLAWESFKSSLDNLSAALIPIDSIAAGLNKLADGINALAAFGEDHPLLASMGMMGAGYATYAGGKAIGGRLADGFGLKGSAIALDGSAAALTRAAAALSGSAAGNITQPGNGKPRSMC